ncbi:uncharacterized protein LOC110859538 [Folsomia candida]|uniref:Uncharacterized protein n=1 Tax=Folsomia candida TaxID=158441 RepID=A0A226DC00_FOLCA|nr:uncharacterized protein LOC110859538 [Folsomia candida]XP_021964193.1 uncharacterized protein LOC110859538 [Folsomia candida]OXA42257.1 hypothetical protein Fcan01_22701 [Folsomia candida]
MKIYVLLAVIVPFSGLVSSTSLPNDPYLASDGRYGRAAAELAKVLVDFLASRTCSNDETRKCFHNDWQRRDSYCSGQLYNTRFSFSAWCGGRCYCCARCYKDNRNLCFWNDWRERDARCTGQMYNRRFSYAGPEGKRCYCCTP